EAQRLKLVTELIKGRRVSRNALMKGRELPGDLYLIEEPSIGLHPRDVRLLIDVLHRLADQGNTVIVIEHNTEIMAEADYVIDMGP
ncbi:MAG TPA: excinuclease ABC subunit A, partial [Akkermansia sp.]|nr:excinuclease ABC subunit A [Akkermansia sp.]